MMQAMRAIREAEQLLQGSAGRVTEYDRLALREQIDNAKNALAGKNPPFSHCREFAAPDAVEFALRRYTMAPTYLPDGQAYTTYGLLDAMDWYRTRIDAPNLPHDKTPLASDRDPEQGGLFSAAEVRTLWKQAERNPLLTPVLDAIRTEADRLPLDKVQADYARCFAPDDYAAMNQTDCPWSSSETLVSFSAPAGTVRAQFRFTLPEEDNESDGLGHVWLDDLRLVSSTGEQPLPNGGFEEGLTGWELTPNCTLETRPGFCGTGHASLLLRNQTSRQRAQAATTAALRPGSHTLRFRAKIDGKLRHGLHIAVRFQDETGKVLGDYETDFNQKSWPTDVMRYNLTMQCCALLFAVTGRREYAEKAKFQMLHFLDNFCQGTEHWLAVNSRPGGSDAYGAVQGGRNLCAIAASYALIRSAGVFTPEEMRRFLALIDYQLHYMMDLRDRAALPRQQAQKNTSNWQTDMCIGTAMMVSVLPELPHRRVWWDNAYAVLRGQLEANLNPDGSWPESLRYHHAALEHFATYAQLLRRETGENWFAQPALQDMFRYSAAVQTPPLRYFGNRVTTPPFGDHALNDGKEYALLAAFLPDLQRAAPSLAETVAATWYAAGCGLPPLRGEAVIAQLLNVPDPAAVPQTPPELPEFAAFPQAGLYLWRGQRDYLAVMSSPQKIGHGHLDQGSFQWIVDGVPLVCDTGIEGYFDASTPWHLCSMSHACLQFHREPVAPDSAGAFINLSAGTYSAERGLCDTPVSSRVMEAGEWGMEIEVCRPGGPGRHRRRIERQGESLTIRDTVTDYDGLVTVSLPLAVQAIARQGNTLHCEGTYGVRFAVELLTPAEQVRWEQGRSTRFFPGEEPQAMTTHLRVTARAADGVTMRLRIE